MSTINIESGGKSIPIAKVGIIDSQEKILLGSLERDLVLQTLGNISIQAGNMFYKLSFDSSGNISTSNNNMVELQSLDNFSISSYDNGTFIFDLSTESLYLVYSKDLIPIAGVSASDYIYLSFINEQTLTGEQKQRLVLNSGAYVKSLNDVAYFSRADVYENQIIFVEDEKQHYILTDINNPNGKSAWTTFYIGMNGGIIYNGLEIQNTNRENLLHLNGVDDFIPGRFNGLKIGDSEKSVKLSVNTKNQTVIDSNTESLIIKTSKADILYYHDGSLGIFGEPPTSDKYKIAINGTTKFNDSVFLERRLTSTDFITTNITHWDGGQGFGLIKTVNNKWFFECDDMVVRGSLVANKLKLKELEVERAYATGGHMLITDGADVDAVYYRLPTAEELETANVANNGNYGTLDANTYYYFITFKDSTEKDDSNAYVALDTTPNATTSTSGEGSSIEEDTLDAENYCPFINGDVLLCQTASGKSAKKYYCLVTYSTNKYAVVKANDFRNNTIYQYNELGEIVNVDTRFLVESGDTLIRVTNILYKNGVYEYKNRRRFIDIDGTRNQITMYDNLGDPNLFAGTPTEFNTYDDINIITGIGPNGALRLRMGELSDLNIPGLTGYGLYGDNVYLKGRLIVKTDDYEEIVGANRGSWVFGNLNKYYINDLVTYNGSVYRCIVEHQNTISSSSIPGVSDFWEIWVQKGTDGTPGSNFSYVNIVGDQVFIYNSGSGTYDKTVIPLTCTAFNVDYDSLINIKFEWVISGTVISSHTYLKSEVTAGSISDSKNIYATAVYEGVNWYNLWNGDSSLTVSCRVYLNNSTDYNSDVFSVYKVQNGADGETPLIGYITNDAISLSADANNNVISYSYANGYFKVFYGLTDVTSGCTFSSTSINCTGSINTSGYYNVTGMTQAATIATLTLTATYNGITITKEFSLSKSRTGSSAILYEVKPSVYTVTKSITNTFTPTSVVFSFYKTEGSSTVSYSGYYRTYSSTDGTVYSLITSSSGTSASVTPGTSYRSIKCDLYSDSGYVNLVDSQTCLIVSDGNTGAAGQDAFTVILSNEAMTVPAMYSGAFPANIFSDYDYSSNVVVYRGSTKLNYAATSGYSYTVSLLTGSRFSTTISTSGTECKIRINNITQDLSGGLYIPDYMVANFYVSILYNNVATGTAFTKTIAVSKAKQGPLLDWIKEWDSNSTLVGSEYVISPKIFAGTNNGGSPTGVIVGRNAFNLTEIGVAGYYNGNNTFYLSALDGSFKFGQGNSSITYNPSTNLITIGSSVAMKWSNITDTNAITDKLTYIDANGIYTGSLNADRITTGTLRADRIAANSLTANHIQMNTITTLGNVTAGSFNLGNGKFIVDANGNLTSTSANIVGNIVANSGSIGGFTISSGRIGSSTNYNNPDGGDLAIYSNLFRVGGSNGYVMFGDNVIPSTSGGAFNATGRVVNKTYNKYSGWGFDTANYGLFIDVTNGTKNFGIESNAALKAPAFINTKIKYLVFNTSYSIDLSQYSVFMCYAASDKNVIMPDEASIAKQFSLSSLPSDFGCVFTFTVIGGSSDITLNNVIDWNMSSINLRLVQGDSVQLLVTKFPNFHYQIINHTN